MKTVKKTKKAAKKTAKAAKKTAKKAPKKNAKKAPKKAAKKAPKKTAPATTPTWPAAPTTLPPMPDAPRPLSAEEAAAIRSMWGASILAAMENRLVTSLQLLSNIAHLAPLSARVLRSRRNVFDRLRRGASRDADDARILLLEQLQRDRGWDDPVVDLIERKKKPAGPTVKPREHTITPSSNLYTAPIAAAAAAAVGLVAASNGRDLRLVFGARASGKAGDAVVYLESDDGAGSATTGKAALGVLAKLVELDPAWSVAEDLVNEVVDGFEDAAGYDGDFD